MAVFCLKYRDTLPILEVVLKNPDGTAHDLTGSTAWRLHILLSDGSKLMRDMVKQAPDASGTLRYTWVAGDWDPVSGGGVAGGLVVGPTIPLAPGVHEHRMEYEVLGAGGARLTFPNGGTSAGEAYDVLRVWQDIGQGA